MISTGRFKAKEPAPKKKMIQDIITLKNRHCGQYCFIVACGPSAGAFDYSVIGKHDIVIGVNDAVLLQDRVKFNYLIFVDDVAAPVYDKNPNQHGAAIIKMKENKYEGAKYFFDRNSDYCKPGYTTSFYALQLALNVFNCRKVFLIGFDYYMDGNKLHFVDRERDTQKMKEFHRAQGFANALYDFTRPVFDGREKDVYNLNPESNLRTFRILDLDKPEDKEEITGIRKLLILGNGVSRNQGDVKKFVEDWRGEIWACNYAFREAPGLNWITRITGHKEALVAADEFRRMKGYDFEIWGPELDGIKTRSFCCDPYWVRDSGTTLAVEALIEGYQKIYCAGFDCGGDDIYCGDMGKMGRTWLRRWQEIKNTFGLDRFTFMGRDIKAELERAGRK